MQTQVLTPEEIAARSMPEVEFLRLPARSSVFSDRAARLRRLSPGHSIGGYLDLVARIADAQQGMLERMPSVPLPSAEELARSRAHEMPPLECRGHARDPIWRAGLREILDLLSTEDSGQLAPVARALRAASDEHLESQARRLLEGVTIDLDVAAAPLLAAGLQVYFTHMVLALGMAAFPRIGAATVCPCCGSRPVASIVRIGGNEAGHRFLHCALCSAQWHMVRIKCAHCEETKGIGYQAIDDGKPAHRKAVKAEVCDECGYYLKVCAMAVDPGVDAVADDLATLALDLLVVESGKTPAGVNFMLIHGDPEPN